MTVKKQDFQDSLKSRQTFSQGTGVAAACSLWFKRSLCLERASTVYRVSLGEESVRAFSFSVDDEIFSSSTEKHVF